MSNLRVRPSVDPLERQRLEIDRRRQRTSERTKRLLHAKTRLIGIDTLALASQVKDRQERERLELERDYYYDDLTVAHARAVTEAEAIRQREARRRAEELNFFRKQQREEQQRRSLLDESALNNFQDMDTLFLKFQGEDPGKAARVKAQQAQQQDWLAAQIEQLARNEANERQAAADYDNTQARIRAVQAENEANYRSDRASRRRALTEFNRQMAAYKKAEAAREAQVTQALDDEELMGQINSRFLNEAVGVQDGTSGFKGFSTEQRQAIIDEQKLQQDAVRWRAEQEAAEDREYAAQQEDIRRAMVRADRERQAQRQQALRNLQKERELQAKEKTMRYDYLDNVVYTNPVSEHFFDQFGQDCR